MHTGQFARMGEEETRVQQLEEQLARLRDENHKLKSSMSLCHGPPACGSNWLHHHPSRLLATTLIHTAQRS